jgi:hypothetical protein
MLFGEQKGLGDDVFVVPPEVIVIGTLFLLRSLEA